METTQARNLSYHLHFINDPRKDRRKMHKLHDILMIAILAMSKKTG